MSKSWEIISKSTPIELTWEGDFQPDTPRTEAKILYLWKQAIRKGSEAYTNGAFLSMISASVDSKKTAVRCIRAQYMYYFAQNREPAFNFHLRPVGVSGIIEIQTPDGPAIVVAKRGKTVTQYPGLLEFIPSGGIDGDALLEGGRVDFMSQFLREFAEETGADPASATSIEPFAFIHDIQSDVYDVCALIRADCAPDTIKLGVSKSGEYSDVVFVPSADIESFIEKNKHIFVPTSPAIIKAMKETRILR
ncbi:MAG: hypothetical protein WCX65_08695 [bacterium]